MNTILLILLALCGLVLLFLLVAAGFLLWLQRNPLVVAKRMRGNTFEEKGNQHNPPDYAQQQAKVTVLTDLPYPSAYPANQFDLYLPKEGQRCPVIIWVHGGGFIAGDKIGVDNLCTLFAAKGYAVIAPNYAVAPEHPYPAAVVQVNEVCHHLTAIAQLHPQLNTNCVFLAGDSAGAQIAAQAAAVETNGRLAHEMGLSPQLAPGALRGAMLCCGPYNLAGLRRVPGLKMRYLVSIWGRAYFGTGSGWHKGAGAAQTNLPLQVEKSYPPTYLTDGNSFSFEVQARALGEALRKKGVPVRERYFPLEEYGEVPHEYQFILDEANAVTAYKDMLEFLAGHCT